MGTILVVHDKTCLLRHSFGTFETVVDQFIKDRQLDIVVRRVGFWNVLKYGVSLIFAPYMNVSKVNQQ